jgi:hypothetical protein
MSAPPQRWLVLGVLASSLLLIAMDATVLNVALPTLAADLRPDATELLSSSTPTASSSPGCSSPWAGWGTGSAAAGC